MEFNEFRDSLVDWMNDRYEGRVFQAQDVVKNNGLHLTGIYSTAQDCNASPNVYINDLYNAYIQEGMSFAAAATILEQQYNKALESIPNNIDINSFRYEDVKDKVFLRVINRKLNQDTLAESPHRLISDDLAVQYRMLFSQNETDIASMVIPNSIYEQWNISLDELHETALTNTERLFPARMDSLLERTKEMMKMQMPGMEQEIDLFVREMEMVEAANVDSMKMYIVTNNTQLNGAACILYPSVQKILADRFGEDIYVLPSSIHEVIVVINAPEGEEEMLREIVVEANMTAVKMDEYLSDSVYTIQDGELVNVSSWEQQIDQAFEEALADTLDEDLDMGMEM